MTKHDDKQDGAGTGFGEQATPFATTLDLGPDVDRLLAEAEAEADFREGRTLTMEEFRVEMKEYLDRLRARA